MSICGAKLPVLLGNGLPAAIGVAHGALVHYGANDEGFIVFDAAGKELYRSNKKVELLVRGERFSVVPVSAEVISLEYLTVDEASMMGYQDSTCPRCDGMGYEPYSEDAVACEMCDGSGAERAAEEFLLEDIPEDARDITVVELELAREEE